MTPSEVQLIAINAAIQCLDMDALEGGDADNEVTEALSILIEARGQLTDKPLPELPHALSERPCQRRFAGPRPTGQENCRPALALA